LIKIGRQFPDDESCAHAYQVMMTASDTHRAGMNLIVGEQHDNRDGLETPPEYRPLAGTG
jgi:hypothetical protein